MKKEIVLVVCTLMLAFTTSTSIAQISYCKDISPELSPDGTCDILGTPCTSDDDCAGGALECIFPTTKTWDETWEMPAGETVDMDIWLNDVPETMLTAGFYIYLRYSIDRYYKSCSQ